MTAESDSKSVRIKIGTLAVLTSLATLISVVPLVITFHRPQLLIIFAPVLLIVLWLQARSYRTDCTETPSIWDFALGGFGAISLPAFGALCLLTIYWVIFWLARLVDWIINSLGGDVYLNIDMIAFWPTIILAVPLVLIFASASQDDYFEQVYPDIAGVKSAFYDLIHFGRSGLVRNAIVFLVTVGILVLIVWFTGNDFSAWWFNLVLLLILFLASATMANLGDESLTYESEAAINAVAILLTSSGYDVLLSPRTGREDVDPLLVDIDLFARSEERALVAVVFGADPDADPPDWKIARDLQPAAWAMERSLFEENSESSPPVELLLVLIGQKADMFLRDYAEDHGIHLSESLDFDVILQILEESDEANLAEICKQHFDFIGIAASSPSSAGLLSW